MDESSIRTAFEAGEFDAATTEALRLYGPEILGMQIAVAGNESDGWDAFQRFSEDLWKGMATFRWEASVRTWAYVLARNALRRGRAARRHASLSASGVSKAVEEVRSRTATFLRTEVKDGIAKLRDALPPDDRMLLVLHVDRGMKWDDIACVQLGALAGDVERTREAARLRKRFQLLKERLRKKAVEQGLLDRA